MKPLIATTMAVLAIALTGCGGGSAKGESVEGGLQATSGGIDRQVEELLTIRRGLYGQVTSVDDVGEHLPEYLQRFGIDVFQVPGGTELDSPVAHTASAERGFYEIELPPSDYVVCSSFRRCVRVALGDELRRLDYEYSVGPGWSAGTWWP